MQFVPLFLFVSLLLGNSILFFSGDSSFLTSFISGKEHSLSQMVLHVLCSAIAILSILLTARFVQARPKSFIILAALSLAAAISVPLLSTCMLFTGYALFTHRSLVPAFHTTIIATMMSMRYCLMFACANFVFFLAAGRALRQATTSSE